MRSGLVFLLMIWLSGCSVIPFRSSKPKPAPQSEAAQADSTGTGTRKSKAKPYSKVIPAYAVSDTGLFRTHLVDDKLFFEIPEDALGRELLLVTTIAQNTSGKLGGAPVGNRVLRWERRGDRILLRSPSYSVVADSTHPIYQAVEASNYAPIVASFDIEAWSADSAAVIDVTTLYTTRTPEFGVRSSSPDRARTFIEKAAAYPENVEVTAIHTYNTTPPAPENSRFKPDPRSESIVVHWSMVELPEAPMEPRVFDSRIGYFSVAKTDYGTAEHRASRYRYITRWRLECRAGESVPCEPAKPIVFHIDPATPPQWIPYIKEGVEDWKAAFQEAGFINAIQARDAPSDSAWSMDDARYSMVRWMPSTTQNAMGPHVHDPRSGEILVSDIQIYHNVLNLLRNWYFVQVAPLDQRAQRFPLPDSLMGRLIRYVVAHEVGHTIGLQHNMKASSMYPADSLRDETFLRRMGHVPSIMDYARFNYLAQPEDNLPPELLVPDVGPYDRFAVRWGYRPVTGVKSSAEARSILDQWAREQDEKPWLRFSTSDGGGAVVGEQTEAVGDADPIYATGLGLRNIRRIVPMLIPATVREGEDFSDLDEVYQVLIRQWATELRHVLGLVGGVEGQEKYGGQDGVRFQLVDPKRQREAVAFLNREAFQTPDYLLDHEVMRRIEVWGTMGRISGVQASLLGLLIREDRLGRMLEFEALASPGTSTYSAAELLTDIRKGLWSELADRSIRIPAMRRELQHSYLDQIDKVLNPGNRRPVTSLLNDVRGLHRRELRALDASLRAAQSRAGDELTRLHIESARIRIDRILDPKG